MIKYMILMLALLVNCGPGTQESPEPTPVERTYSFCDYDVDGVCVIESGAGSMNVDMEILSWGLQTLEYEVNFFYPGLDFATLAEENKLKIKYRWANLSTLYQGTYNDANVMAKINLRRGSGITPLMECSDRYYVALHEVLHFIADRYLFAEYQLENYHSVPYIFNQWALDEGLPVDYTVEGRLYTLIWRLCYDLAQ